MLRWSLTFLVLALIAAIVGFGGVLGYHFEDIGKILFAVFLVLFIVSLVTGGLRPPSGEPPPEPMSEKTKERIAIVILCVFAIVASSLGGALMGSSVAEQSMRKQAIDHGYARYHPTTGAWEWIERAESE